MCQYVPYTILRKFGVEHQGYVRYGADPKVIVQFDNEQNMPDDNAYYLDVMHGADADGHRKVVIFNDSVGVTEEPMWRRRRDSLLYAAKNGHYVGLHAYGITTDGGDIYHPMTELSGWKWFAGRFVWLYALMPDAQPNLILTECGAGGFQRSAGSAEIWLKDVCTMSDISQAYPYLQSFHWWTVGGRGALGFERDHLDDWIPVLS